MIKPIQPINPPRLRECVVVNKSEIRQRHDDPVMWSLRFRFQNDRWNALDISSDEAPREVAFMLYKLARTIEEDIARGVYGEDYADYCNQGEE